MHGRGVWTVWRDDVHRVCGVWGKCAAGSAGRLLPLFHGEGKLVTACVAERIHVLGKRRLLLAMSVVSALGSRWTARLFLLAFVGGKCRTPFVYRIHSLSLSESRYILLGHLVA